MSIFGIPDKILIKNESWIVPEKYDNVVPMYNGKNIKWSIK